MIAELGTRVILAMPGTLAIPGHWLFLAHWLFLRHWLYLGHWLFPDTGYSWHTGYWNWSVRLVDVRETVNVLCASKITKWLCT